MNTEQENKKLKTGKENKNERKEKLKEKPECVKFRTKSKYI
jgi:hypothetical protein